MPPKNPAGGAAQKVTSRTASQAQTSNTSRTQGEPPEPSFDDDLDDGLEGADVTQLREQIQVLTRDQRNDRDMLERILVQLTALTAAQTPLPQDPVRSVERDASISTDTQDRIPDIQRNSPILNHFLMVLIPPLKVGSSRSKGNSASMPIILKMRKPKCFTFSTEPLWMHRNTSNPDMMTIPKHALFQPQKWCNTWPPSMSTQIKYMMQNIITTAS